MAQSGNDILHKFWELEEHPRSNPLMSQEEREVLKHFQARKPRNPRVEPIGESRSQRFLTLEKSLRSKNQFGARVFRLRARRSHSAKYSTYPGVEYHN